MKFIGTKRDGKLVYPPVIAEKKRRYWERVPDGAVVESSLKQPRKNKSHDQVEMIWGLLMGKAVIELDDRGYDTSFLYNLPDPTGIKIEEEDLCRFFYQVCPIYNEDGQRITLSKTDTKQASDFFEKVRSWMASQWQIDIPDPDPNWKAKKGASDVRRT